MKSGNLNFLEPSGPLQACNGTALPLPLPLPHSNHQFVSSITKSIMTLQKHSFIFLPDRYQGNVHLLFDKVLEFPVTYAGNGSPQHAQDLSY